MVDALLAITKSKKIFLITPVVLVYVFMLTFNTYENYRLDLYFGLSNIRLASYQKPIIWKGSSENKSIALTFDDGPNPEITVEILKILKNENIKATFFVIGKNVKKYPSIVKQAFDNGNEIENHTYSHRKIDKLSVSALSEELIATNKVINDVVGYRPIYFRPPRGIIAKSVYKTSTNLNHDIIYWTDSYKKNTNLTVNEYAEKIANRARSGSIILLHDCKMNGYKDIEVLRLLIKKLKKRKYNFQRLDEMLKEGKSI